MSTPERRDANAVSTITVPVRFESEQRGDGGALKLSGLAAVYNSPSEDLGFFEVLEPSAFRDAIKASDQLLLWQHDHSQPLARKSAGNLKLEDRGEGLWFSATLPATQLAKDAVELVRSGVVTQMSFQFGMRGGKDRWEVRDGQKWRYISKIGQLMEVSLVSTPAYTATKVAARQLEQRITDTVRRERWERLSTRTRPAYGPKSQHSYWRDLVTLAEANLTQHNMAMTGRPWADLQWLVEPHYVHGGAEDARQRLFTVEQRATNTTASTAGGGFIPTGVPAYIGSAFTDAARAVGVLPSVMRVEPLPDVGMVVKQPKITTGSSVAVQAAELDQASSTALVEALESDPVVTIAGFNDVSWQLIDRSEPTIDVVIARELGRAYGAKLDTQILAGAGSGGEMTGLLTVSGTLSEAYTDSSPTQAEAWGTILKLYSDAQNAWGVFPDLLLMHPRRYAWLTAWRDTAGAQVEINWPAGLTVQTVPSITTTAGAGTNEDRLIFLRREEVPLYLAPPRFIVDPHTIAHTGSVRLVAYAYGALSSTRNPLAISILTGTGLSTPSFT